MLKAIFWAGFAVLICSMAMAAPPATTTAEKVDYEEAPRKALSVKHKEFAWKGAEFAAVIGELQTAAGVNIIVDWKAIRAAGVGEKELVTLTARGVTIDETLDLIAKAGDLKLDFGTYIVGGNIIISTAQVAARETRMGMFDISDLVKVVPGDQRAEDMDALQLMQGVADCVDRESWGTVGDTPWTFAGVSPSGALQYFRRNLIVKATERNQAQVAEFLAELRKRAEKLK